MPSYSDDTLLKRSINSAMLDRESFSDCYDGKGPESVEALRVAKAIQALAGKRMASLTTEERKTAFLALLYAEQWEASLAESQASKKDKKHAQLYADLFREVRIRRWGKTNLEVSMENSTDYVIQPGGSLIKKLLP